MTKTANISKSDKYNNLSMFNGLKSLCFTKTMLEKTTQIWQTHRINIWHIYLHLLDFFVVNFCCADLLMASACEKNPQHAEPLPQVCVLYKVPVVTFPTNAWNIWWFRNPAFTTWGWYVVEIPLSPLFTWWTIHPRWLFWDFRPTTTSTNKKDPSTNRTAVLRNGILISFPWA